MVNSDEELLGKMFDARLKEIEELKDQLTRATALLSQATHMVDDSYPNWHRNVEFFLINARNYV